MTRPPWIGLITFYGCALALLTSTYSPAIQIFSLGLLILTSFLTLQKWQDAEKNKKDHDR